MAIKQRLNVILGGRLYRMRLMWNIPLGAWVLDVADVNNAPIANGLPLVTGADIVQQLAYLGFTGKLAVVNDNGDPNPPGYEGLGTTGHLIWV